MTVPPQSMKIIHLSHVVDYPVQSQEKGLHVEHCFCPQTKWKEEFTLCIAGDTG